MAPRRRPVLSEMQKNAVETQISAEARRVRFIITEYSVEGLASKVRDGEYYVPEYQRNLVWDAKTKSRFIESVLIGLPIPFLFLWQDEEGKFEIVDGSQRLRTLTEFMDNELRLAGLELLTESNGLCYSDFEPSRRRRFNAQSIRGIILDSDTPPSVRTEMFSRINTSGKQANEAEIRRGSLPGPITDLIAELAENTEFARMTPLSAKRIVSREREELVVRFFAYLSGFEDDRGELFGYTDQPKKFIYEYVRRENKQATENPDLVSNRRARFLETIGFVSRIFPTGFLKATGHRQVPRARYEAIAIGAALAIKENPDVLCRDVNVEDWIDGEEFRSVTTSDGANVRSKLINRVRFVEVKLKES